jgi:putative LysE/RhtB family amino acid efflux pump
VAALRIAGAAYLAFLGVRSFRAAPAAAADGPAPLSAPHPRRGLAARAWASTLVLTLTSPATILSFAALFAAITTPAGAGAWRVPALVAGVFAGSAAWWLFLSTAVAGVRTRLRARHLLWVSRGAGALLVAFAAFAFASALFAPHAPR